MVNADSRIFRRRIFANLFAFSVEFHDSKIRLNIRCDLMLTKTMPGSWSRHYKLQWHVNDLENSAAP
jgi:hypothetical protein